jgi:hypothetical protein
MIEFIALFVLTGLAVVGWLWISITAIRWIEYQIGKPRPRYRRHGL